MVVLGSAVVATLLAAFAITHTEKGDGIKETEKLSVSGKKLVDADADANANAKKVKNLNQDKGDSDRLEVLHPKGQDSDPVLTQPAVVEHVDITNKSKDSEEESTKSGDEDTSSENDDKVKASPTSQAETTAKLESDVSSETETSAENEATPAIESAPKKFSFRSPVVIAAIVITSLLVVVGAGVGLYLCSAHHGPQGKKNSFLSFFHSKCGKIALLVYAIINAVLAVVGFCLWQFCLWHRILLKNKKDPRPCRILVDKCRTQDCCRCHWNPNEAYDVATYCGPCYCLLQLLCDKVPASHAILACVGACGSCCCYPAWVCGFGWARIYAKCCL